MWWENAERERVHRFVPDTFTRAVDAAFPGDLVLVADGTCDTGARMREEESLQNRLVLSGVIHGVRRSPSDFTTHEPSEGNPGAARSGPPSQPAAIIATA